MDDYAKIFIDEIECLCGISLSMISDRGAQFTSMFWRSFQKKVGYQGEVNNLFSSLNGWSIEVHYTLKICLELV